MIFSEHDRRLISDVAELWVSRGGDAEGLDWVYQDLKKRIAEVHEEQNPPENEASELFKEVSGMVLEVVNGALTRSQK